MSTFTTSLSDIANPALRDLVRYWRKLSPAPVIPHRQHFNPVEIPHCLRHIILVDVCDGTPRYFIRLAGSSVNPVYQKSVTGQYLEDIFCDEDRPGIIAQYDHSVMHQAPTYMSSTVMVPSGKRLSYERVILPMTTNGRSADKLLVGINFFDVKQDFIDRPGFKLKGR